MHAALALALIFSSDPPSIGACAASIVAQDEKSWARVHAYQELARLLTAKDRPADALPLWNGLAPELAKIAVQSGLEYDGNIQSVFYSNLEQLAAVLPDRATAICNGPKPPLLAARCFATTSRGAPVEERPALIAEAAARAKDGTRARPDTIALGNIVDLLVDALVTLPDPATSPAAKDILATAQLIGGHYPYLHLPAWAEKLANAGLESTAAELARAANGDEAIDGLAPAAMIACDKKRASGAELAREAAGRVLKEKIYRENIERMALAAAALHRCGDTKSAGVLFDKARELAEKEPDQRPLTKVLHALARAGDQARIDALLTTLLAKNDGGDLAFCARELAWDGYFDISRKIIATLPAHEQNIAVSDLSNHLVRAGRAAEAIELAQKQAEPDRQTDLLERIAGDCETYKQGCAKAAIDAALAPAKDDRTQGHTRQQIVGALARAGRVEEAYALAHQKIRSTGNAKDDALVHAQMLAELAEWSAEHDHARTIAVVKEAVPIADGVRYDDDRDWKLQMLARAAHVAGDRALALKTAKKIRREDMRAPLLKWFKEMEAMESGDVWRALKKLPNDASKARAVIDAYLAKPPPTLTCP